MVRGPIPDKSTDRPTVKDVLDEARAFYDLPGNSVGGNLHIVLDDGNLEDHHIQSCLNEAEEDGDEAGVRLASHLLQLSRTQRKQVYRRC